LPPGFSAGAVARTIVLPGLPAFASFICYEAIFPRSVPYKARPHVLVNVTNDAWFGTSGGPHQHLAHARFRAIEQGVPMIRAANTGISAIIDPYGRVTASLGLGNSGILDAPLPKPSRATLYSRFGDLTFLVLLLTMSAAFLICRRTNLH
jgi:apolipoprotein N-acyltransferase